MISVLRSLAQRGDQRDHLLFVSARALEELLFREEITELADQLRLRVVEALDKPHEGWTGGTGFLDAQVLAANLPRQRGRLDYFICGPPPMVTGVIASLRQIGVAPHHMPPRSSTSSDRQKSQDSPGGNRPMRLSSISFTHASTAMFGVAVASYAAARLAG